jgi:hypothetical protein
MPARMIRSDGSDLLMSARASHSDGSAFFAGEIPGKINVLLFAGEGLIFL